MVYCSKHSLFGKIFRHSIVKPCFWFCILMSKTRVIVLIPEKLKSPHLCISVSVGVVARHPLYFPYLKKHLTSSVVEEYFSHLIKPGVKNAVTRWAGGEKAVCCESHRGIKIHSGPYFTFASVHHYFKSVSRLEYSFQHVNITKISRCRCSAFVQEVIMIKYTS